MRVVFAGDDGDRFIQKDPPMCPIQRTERNSGFTATGTRHVLDPYFKTMLIGEEAMVFNQMDQMLSAVVCFSSPS